MLNDFPKIHCPFIRKEFAVNISDFKKYGSSLQLRLPKVYLVIPEVNPGYEWVFNSDNVVAVEKLDGSNVKLETKKGRLINLQNRKNIIDPLQIVKGKTFILQGVFEAIGKGYINQEGIQAGELIGKKLQGNPYKLDGHLWYPFTKSLKHLSYKSFHEHDRTFDNWSLWFKDYLISRFTAKRGHKEFAEGIVFYDMKRKSEGKTYMAKLRRNMFDWFYSNKIEIYDYKY